MTSDAEFADFSGIVCAETGVSVRDADVQDDAMIEDVRALTGVLAAEFELAAGDVTGLRDAARWAAAAHRATMRSDTFALYAALAMRAYDEGAGRW